MIPAVLLAVVGRVPGHPPPADVPRSYTRVTGPPDNYGGIDYEAALNARLGRWVTPEANAMVGLWRALGPRPEGGDGMPARYFELLGTGEPLVGDFLIDQRRFASSRHLDQNTFYDRVSARAFRPWVPADDPLVAEWVAANDKPLATVADAVRRPCYFNPVVGYRTSGGPPGLLLNGPHGHIEKFREVAQLLVVRAMLRTGEADVDAAWADILTCHRLGRQVARGGAILDYVIGAALAAWRRTPLSPT